MTTLSQDTSAAPTTRSLTPGRPRPHHRRWGRGLVALLAAVAAVAVLPGTAAAQSNDKPGGTSGWTLTCPGDPVIDVVFADLSGIGPTQGTPKITLKPPKITLKDGNDPDNGLWVWHHQVLHGDPAGRKDCELTGPTASGTPVQSYSLLNARVSKIDIKGIKAGTSNIEVESAEIVADAIIANSPGHA